MSLPQRDLLSLFDRLDREVWIVTAADEGRRAGLVATFVSPASIAREFPRLLAGFGKTHETWKFIERSGAFAAHLIEETQLDLVWRFGLESSRDADKFAGLAIKTGATGSPILERALAWFDCRVEGRLDTGDRTVYLAEVVGGAFRHEGKPLRLQRLIELAPPDKLAVLRDQLQADAAHDAEMIRQWRRGEK